MEENLEKALSRVLDDYVPVAPSVAAPAPSVPRAEEPSSLSISALDHYRKAQDYLRQGKWAEYGKEIEALEKALLELVKEWEGRKE
jgi:uncharacterized membrane protein (UPF0182 family)